MSVDPLSPEYPMLTPYQFAENTPIRAVDLDGLEATIENDTRSDGKTIVRVVVTLELVNNVTLPKKRS